MSEAVVYFEMWSTNAVSKPELADDLGLELLGIFIVVPGSYGVAPKHTDIRVYDPPFEPTASISCVMILISSNGPAASH